MINYINKNINTSIKWSWSEGKTPRKNTINGINNLRQGQKIVGLNIFDKQNIVGRHSPKSWSDTKNLDNPTGYCGSIELSGNSLQIWTNGKYQFIKKEIAVKLFKELLKRLTN